MDSFKHWQTRYLFLYKSILERDKDNPHRSSAERKESSRELELVEAELRERGVRHG